MSICTFLPFSVRSSGLILNGPQDFIIEIMRISAFKHATEFRGWGENRRTVLQKELGGF
jgi:hypothetical protein